MGVYFFIFIFELFLCLFRLWEVGCKMLVGVIRCLIRKEIRFEGKRGYVLVGWLWLIWVIGVVFYYFVFRLFF